LIGKIINYVARKTGPDTKEGMEKQKNCQNCDFWGVWGTPEGGWGG